MKHFIAYPLHFSLIFSAALFCASAPAQDDPPRQDPRLDTETEVETRKPKPPEELPKPKMEKRTWMGVATGEVPPVLRQHLDLTEGFGVLIAHVLDDSPASKAGLKAGDVLSKLDDQLLTTPEHLSLLIRSKKKGDTVRLTYLRKGEETVVQVNLDEKELPRFERLRPPVGPQASPKDWQNWHENFRRQQREWMEKFNEHHRNRGPRPQHQSPSRRDMRGSGKPAPKAPRGPKISSESTVKIDNDQGEVTVLNKDGKGRIEIFDAEGKKVYEGPFDREKGIDGLPENAKQHLKKMKVDHIGVFADPVVPGPKPNRRPGPPKEPQSENPGEEL